MKYSTLLYLQSGAANLHLGLALHHPVVTYHLSWWQTTGRMGTASSWENSAFRAKLISQGFFRMTPTFYVSLFTLGDLETGILSHTQESVPNWERQPRLARSEPYTQFSVSDSSAFSLVIPPGRHHSPELTWSLLVVKLLLEDILLMTSGSWSSTVSIAWRFRAGHSRTPSFSPLHKWKAMRE